MKVPLVDLHAQYLPLKSEIMAAFEEILESMQPVMDFARKHGLRIIEDASQAHGATYQSQRVGSFGDVAAFSLYYSKNLGAFGEAGICTTNDGRLAEKMRMIRDHGSRVRYRHEIMGVNARLDEMQAAVLQIKMPY